MNKIMDINMDLYVYRINGVLKYKIDLLPNTPNVQFIRKCNNVEIVHAKQLNDNGIDPNYLLIPKNIEVIDDMKDLNDSIKKLGI